MPGTSLPRTYQKEMERLENLTRRFAGNDDNAGYRRQLCTADLGVFGSIFRAHFEADSPGQSQAARVQRVTRECWDAYYKRIRNDFRDRVRPCCLASFTDNDLDCLWWDLYQARLATGAVPAGALEFASKVLEGIRRWIANGGYSQDPAFGSRSGY